MMTDERRTGTRRRTLRSAKIVYGDYRYVVDCVVRDSSPTGLRIRCNYVTDIPSDFYIYDPTEHTLQRAEVMWRRDSEMGLKFLSEPINVHESTDPRYARFRFM